MLRRHLLQLIVLLAVPMSVLHAGPGASTAGAATPATVACVYLPAVYTAQTSQRANAPSAKIAAANCPPSPAPSPDPSPEPSPAPPPEPSPSPSPDPSPEPSPVPPPVSGPIQVRPEHRVIPSQAQPVQYVVVLDQSGSMSANFKGQCDARVNGRTPPPRSFYGEPPAFWQCANGPLYDSNGDGIGDTAVEDRVTGTGPIYYWRNQNERRITVAKQAVETLIKHTNMPGNAGYTTVFPDDQMALVWFNNSVQRDGNNEVFANGKPFTNDPTDLVSKLWARTTGVDQYRTDGGTNTAAGLYRTSLVLDAAPKQVVHSDGRTYAYRRIVILITDGVPYIFFHESQPNLYAGMSDSTAYPLGSSCRALGILVTEDADCQTTAVGGVYTATLTINGASTRVPLERPLTQVVNVSQNMLQKNGYEVFVVTLSTLPSGTLEGGVATFPSYFYAAPRFQISADGSTNVDTILKMISSVVESGQCSAVAPPTWVSTMDPANRPGASLPYTFPAVGEVELKNSTQGTAYRAPIVVVDDGTMSYSLTGVPDGTYELAATMYYRGEDGLTRAYDLIEDQGRLQSSVTITWAGANDAPPPLKLRLNGDVCLSP